MEPMKSREKIQPDDAESFPFEGDSIGTIGHVDLLTVRMPFVTPFGTSVQVWSHKEVLLLRLESDGMTGWGECVADPDPFYASETTGTARHIIRDFLLPLVESGMTIGELEARFHHVRGHEMAKATIENALLVLLAQRKGLPLHALLGWPRRPIPSGISIGLRDTPEELLDAVGRAVAKKYHRVKMKVKKGKDVEWVARVRDRYPGVPLMVDANGDYTLRDIDHLRRLDDFDLTMIEQPLGYADVYQHSLLQRELKTPICLDESLHSLDDVKAAIALDACRVVNIKQGRVGGLIESLRIARYATQHDIGVWSGGMDETGIGRAVNIHLQADPAFDIPGDTSETSNYFQEDIADPPVILREDGFIDIPEGPGLGMTIDPVRLGRYLLNTERVR
jgi:o-succinylbenzoate synthase